MRHRRRISMPMRQMIGLLALATCLTGGVVGLRYLDDDRTDPCFICGYPGYKRLHEGMSAAAVKRILGTPTRKRINAQAHVLDSATFARLQAQQKRINAESGKIYKAFYETDPRPTGWLENQLMQKLEGYQKQEEQVRSALSVLVKEVWDYDVPGWHGHIEVSIDVFGKVSSMGCGYV